MKYSDWFVERRKSTRQEWYAFFTGIVVGVLYTVIFGSIVMVALKH